MPKVLDGKYTLGKALGEGGFCKVDLARDDDGNKYAVKTWLEFQKKMFEDETKATEIDWHPNLVKYIEANQHGELDHNGKIS